MKTWRVSVGLYPEQLARVQRLVHTYGDPDAVTLNGATLIHFAVPDPAFVLNVLECHLDVHVGNVRWVNVSVNPDPVMPDPSPPRPS